MNLKKILFIVPFSLSLLSASYSTNKDIARGGGHAGGGSANVHSSFGDNRSVGSRAIENRAQENRAYNNGYNSGYYNSGSSGMYYNGGYSPVLLPDPVLTPNDDMDSIYNQNLKNMRKTGQ